MLTRREQAITVPHHRQRISYSRDSEIAGSEHGRQSCVCSRMSNERLRLMDQWFTCAGEAPGARLALPSSIATVWAVDEDGLMLFEYAMSFVSCL